MGFMFGRCRQRSAKQEIVSLKPDYMMPLRMQAQGRSLADVQRRRVRRLLWLCAMKDRGLWHHAVVVVIAVEFMHVALAPAMSHTMDVAWLLRLALSSASTLAGAVFIGAASQVHQHLASMTYLDN